ncbi:hypothetical protein M9H77_05290 [Catharanthus roseus]|uniref:Uncharacterized protein n=1 Tax=Catharanthus roseus TaxID=4058 RepID=A0ACC0CGU1_CATRO|nr:hypothetical protein M9H77_05290 [Catharanthus roseus]
MSNLEEGKSLPETPTWAVATVVTLLVSSGILFHSSLKRFGEWLRHTKRKPLLAALEKIKDELMVFGLLSLLMGHWISLVSKICVKSSDLSNGFYLCEPAIHKPYLVTHIVLFEMGRRNISYSSKLETEDQEGFCPEGRQSFASYESLEQLHRLLFVLGITHVLYSFYAVALTMLQIYTWRKWENHAYSLALEASSRGSEPNEASRRITRISTFVSYHTSHPWSNHRVLVWLLCFSRQFWSSINHTDYKALRVGFITSHQLPLTYDFHKYMLRSMEEEFRDIVGISIPLWIFTILCILLGVHGTNIYFWLSFSPALLVVLIGTKLHVIVVKLAVEIVDAVQQTGVHRFNLRDELFWFGNPRLLLWLIQFVTFQNAFEMAMYLWSLWETKGPSCFTENLTFLVIRLTFGLVSQFWCSFITFPLYVIVAQMGSRYKKTIVSDHVRKSLYRWKRKATSRREDTSSRFLLDEHNDGSSRSHRRSYSEGCSSMRKFKKKEISVSAYDDEDFSEIEFDLERCRKSNHSNMDEKDNSSLLHRMRLNK